MNVLSDSELQQNPGRDRIIQRLVFVVQREAQIHDQVTLVHTFSLKCLCTAEASSSVSRLGASRSSLLRAGKTKKAWESKRRVATAAKAPLRALEADIKAVLVAMVKKKILLLLGLTN
jgi:hypothetical protein